MPSKTLRHEFCLLIRAQAPYKKSAADVLYDKQQEMQQLYTRLSNSAHPSRAIMPHREVALWFYKGGAFSPKNVQTFATWCRKIYKYALPVLVYFPNELDWYRQSCSQVCELSLGNERDYIDTPKVPPHFMRLNRRHNHDAPGNNVLFLTGMHDGRGRTEPRLVNLSEYEICRGPRTGMSASSYFADGKYGQRLAMLRHVSTNEPAHYVHVDFGANLAQPYAAFARRL